MTLWSKMGPVFSRLFETLVARGCLLYKCIMYNLQFNYSIAVSFSMAEKKTKSGRNRKMLS